MDSSNSLNFYNVYCVRLKLMLISLGLILQFDKYGASICWPSLWLYMEASIRASGSFRYYYGVIYVTIKLQEGLGILCSILFDMNNIRLI